MTRRSIWWMVAVIFTVINLVSTVYAAVVEEQLHTDIHVALMLVGAYFVWRLSPRRVSSR